MGYLAVQIAKHLGAEVFATISSPEKAEMAKSFGADHCVNYRETDFAEEVLKLTDGAGVDAVFDTIGGPVFAASFPCTAVYGNVTTLDEISCSQEEIELAKLRNLGLDFELVLTPMLLDMHEARQWQTSILEEAAGLIDAGTIKIHNEHVFDLGDIAGAHDLIQDDYVRCSKNLRNAMESHIVALLGEGLSVVLDFPANTLRQRQWLRGISDQTDVPHQLHFLDVPDEICKQRLRQRNAAGEHEFQASDAQFDLFNSHFVPPMASEGFNIIRHGD